MKISKSKLKQLIKEELQRPLDEISFGLGNPPAAEGRPVSGTGDDHEHRWWIEEMEKIMEEAHELYEKMPPEGKENFTKNFEDYAERWREEMQDEANLQNREDTEWLLQNPAGTESEVEGAMLTAPTRAEHERMLKIARGLDEHVRTK